MTLYKALLLNIIFLSSFPKVYSLEFSIQSLLNNPEMDILNFETILCTEGLSVPESNNFSILASDEFLSKGFINQFSYNVTETFEKIFSVATTTDRKYGKTLLLCLVKDIYKLLSMVQMVEEMRKKDFCGFIKSNPNSITNITVASDIYVATIMDGEINLWEFYSIKNISFCNKIEDSQIKTNSPYIFLQKVLRRRDFKGVEIIGGALNSEKLEYAASFTKDGNGITRIPLELKSGLEVNMFRLMRDWLNFSEIAKTSNNTDSSNDLRRAVIDGDIDICLTGAVATVERQATGIFLQPTHTFFGINVYISKPSSNSFRDIYASAFEKSVWLAMTSTWIVIVLTLKLFVFIKLKIEDLEEDDETISRDGILMTVAAGAQQGWYISPSSLSLKIVSFCGYLSGLVSFIAFSAAIVSNLSVKNSPIKSFNDVLMNDYKLFLETSLNHQYAHLEDNVVKRMEKKSIEQIMPEIERGDSAMVSWPDVFYLFMRKSELHDDKDVCNKFTEFPVTRTLASRAMFMKSNSPLLESFNCVIILMKERGLSFRPIHLYTRDFQVNCINMDIVNYTDLGLNDVITAFAILLIGYLASIVILGFEILWHAYVLKKIFLD